MTFVNPTNNYDLKLNIPHCYKTINELEHKSNLLSLTDEALEIGQHDSLRLIAAAGITALLKLGLVTFRILIPKRFNNAEAKNYLWPLFAKTWVDELPYSKGR